MTETREDVPLAAALKGPAARLNEVDPLRRVLLCPAALAYRDQARLDGAWETEEFLGRPDFTAALGEYEAFRGALEEAGVAVETLAEADGLGISSIYVRDSNLVAPGGVVLCRMRNAYRAPEPAALGAWYAAHGVPVLGAIAGAGLLEGGDVVWLDRATCAVGEGYRTNAEGIRQLREILGPGVHVEVAALPHHRGPGACLHLMSILSPLDRDLALVFSPLMPARFRDWLMERGIRLVEVPEEEFEPAMACNVLALGPRRCLVIAGSPRTRARLEAAGCEVLAYAGREISLKGGGGPTCLTRPLVRG